MCLISGLGTMSSSRMTENYPDSFRATDLFFGHFDHQCINFTVKYRSLWQIRLLGSGCSCLKRKRLWWFISRFNNQQHVVHWFSWRWERFVQRRWRWPCCMWWYVARYCQLGLQMCWKGPNRRLYKSLFIQQLDFLCYEYKLIWNKAWSGKRLNCFTLILRLKHRFGFLTPVFSHNFYCESDCVVEISIKEFYVGCRSRCVQPSDFEGIYFILT